MSELMQNLAESQTQISETLITLLNDLNKDANYRDINMKEQNRHLARIATALEKMVGGTNIGEHVERYEKKLEEEGKTNTAESKEVGQEEKAQPNVTHDDLKALCLSKSREETSNKPKLKALLKEYGAAKVNDVKDGDVAVIIERINKGDF